MPLLCCIVISGARATPPGADAVAREIEFVNHFAAVRNIHYGTPQAPVVVFDRSADGQTRVNTFERWRRNDHGDGPVGASDLAIFRSGKLRGTGILVTEPRDPTRSRDYRLWLPSLRKVRRFAEPDPADNWGGSNFSYGDIYVRRPHDEQHRLLGRETFDDCLGVVQLPPTERDRHTAAIPGADCSARGRAVFRLQSRPYRNDLGYDERISWVDVETFADYRALYYRDGQPVKVIDKAWRSMQLDDPRAQYWVYCYARSFADDRQGMAFVAPDAVQWNTALDPDLWSEQTLRRIRR